MAVVLALTWPRILGEYTAITSITVPLILGVPEDLRRLWQRTKLSTNDLTSRAMTSYEFLDSYLRSSFS